MLYSTLVKRLLECWKLSGLVVISDVGNDYYVVRFTKKDDYERALFLGPWLVQDHYLTISRWTPDFNAFSCGLKNLAVRVHFLDLSIQFITSPSLRGGIEICSNQY